MALEHLFDAELEYRPGVGPVLSPEAREGELIGNGDGVARGDKVAGRLRWSVFAADCPYRPSAEEEGMETTAALQRGLDATGIPPERLGQARTARLSQPEREFYFWILRSFAAGTPPEGEATCSAAARFGLDADQALAVFARQDLVHADASGRPVVAYPFSAEERGHRVLIDEHWVEAMCAIDALGIAPMLGLPIEITSHDPLSAGEIWVRLDPGDGAWWEPEAAVVLAASTRCEGPSFRGCCDVLNFFEAKENAERYLSNHDEINGFPISIADAIELGRLVFGDLLTDS